jgi:hypothetical protein
VFQYNSPIALSFSLWTRVCVCVCVCVMTPCGLVGVHEGLLPPPDCTVTTVWLFVWHCMGNDSWTATREGCMICMLRCVFPAGVQSAAIQQIALLVAPVTWRAAKLSFGTIVFAPRRPCDCGLQSAWRKPDSSSGSVSCWSRPVSDCHISSLLEPRTPASCSTQANWLWRDNYSNR